MTGVPRNSDLSAKSMPDGEVQVASQVENPQLGQHAHGDRSGGGGGGPETDGNESLPDSGPTEVDDKQWLLLADVALTPQRGDPALCSCLDVEDMNDSVHSMNFKLQYLIKQANDLQFGLLAGQSDQERRTVAAKAQTLLQSCQPFFSDLEAGARSTRPLVVPVTRRQLENEKAHLRKCMKLCEFSQQLCDRLEQLVLTFCSYDLLCVDDTDPNSVSPFCLGQAQLGHLRLTTFRYWKPMPYLAQINTGLYKRMRWNVERVQAEQQISEEQGGQSTEKQAENEYYFLCYEDIPSTHALTDEGGSSSSSSTHSNKERMWSIGLWVQVDPNPTTDDIYEWSDSLSTGFLRFFGCCILGSCVRFPRPPTTSCCF
ncbi:UPF0575 protein C19orf67 homolog isoform X2 [Betta splendens]|uniref:UPF0575 protein C19orf67 homolog isoform X2 n=1 Tax=Betta splendens TaxID=158456 RepID=A0A9W2XVC2_BETSP|nr:UPF0575 protein C19orf67 homolog isoform X2 [Betta splendens]